jgi:hypothetical protein
LIQKLLNRIADVLAEENKAIAAEGVLQSNINAEETARISAVSNEATLRTNADSTLQINIENEASTRLANDNTL